MKKYRITSIDNWNNKIEEEIIEAKNIEEARKIALERNNIEIKELSELEKYERKVYEFWKEKNKN